MGLRGGRTPAWQRIVFLSASLGTAFWTISSGGVTQKTETLGGIRFVHNEGVGRWGATHPVGLDLVRTIGGLEESDPDLAFNDPYDIDVDSSGNIYVLDTANNRIQKLGPDGRFLRSIGRAGQGPGDLQAAFSIDIDPEDLLYVSEARNSRLQIFNTSGKPVGQIKYKSSDIFLIRKLPSGLIVRGGGPSLRALLENPKRLPPLLEILEPNGKVKKAFGEATDYQDALVNWMANATEFDTDRQGNIILSFKHQNRIDKYSPDGEMMWRADRPLNYGTEVISKGSITRSRRGTVIQGPILNRVSMGIAADAEGRVWVNTFNRQLTPEEKGETISVNNAKRIIREGRIARMDINKLEVFGPDGGLLGEIPLSHLAHGIRIVGNTLFVWERENARIYQYRFVDR